MYIEHFAPIICAILGVQPKLGSKHKLLHAFNCATLLFRYRVQVNFARDFWCGVPQQCLHGSYWSSYPIKHYRVAVPQKMSNDMRSLAVTIDPGQYFVLVETPIFPKSVVWQPF